MAKPGLTQVTTAQTFQTWLDRTNDLVDILASDAVTASALGDTTTGNATLVGSFTANTVIAFDTLRTDTFSPKIGSTSISATAPINTTTSLQVAQTLTSANGPRINLSSGSVIWTTGFENTTNNDFIINVGTGSTKLRLTTTGNLTTAGSITSGNGGFIGNVTGNVTGDLTGNVTGTVSSLSNHTTSNLAEGTNLYFTTARARSSISAGTGITITNGQISIGQAVATTSNVTFKTVSFSDHAFQFLTGDTPIFSDDYLELRAKGVYRFRFFENGNFIARNTIRSEGNIVSEGFITANGDITAFASSSDIRKKENIVRIDNALEKVSQINGYTYNFKGDDRKITGVIAQELEAVLPEAVYEVEDEEYSTSKAVRYGNIVGLLIEAIKDLKKEVEELRNAH